MKKFNHVAHCAFNLTLALSATLFPLKSTNVFAEDSTSPPTCEEGYEYIESVGKCYKKCQDGWERNPETNRCRKVQTDPGPDEAPPEEAPSSEEPSDDPPSDSPADLLPSLLPDPDTDPVTTSPINTAPAASATVPPSASTVETTCKDGYEYIESVGKCYKKCQDGYERNPETNRCKKAETNSSKKTSDSSSAKTKTNNGADYGVDVPETGGNYAFIAGGIIAALVAAGVGFAAYQYRLEIKEFVKKHFKKSEKSS